MDDLVARSAAFSLAMLAHRKAFVEATAGSEEGTAVAPFPREAAREKARDFLVEFADPDSKAYRALLPCGEKEDRKAEATRMAFWINTFNALASLSIVELGVTEEISRYPAFRLRSLFDAGGIGLSLDDIEEGILRGNRGSPGWPFRPFGRDDPRRELALREPDFRLHFALNCGAASCPPLRPYSATGLEGELSRAQADFAAAHFHPDPSSRSIVCSRLFLVRKRDLAGTWLGDPAYRGWRVHLEPFDLHPGSGE